MKKPILVLLLLSCVLSSVLAQRKVTVKWAPGGLLFGKIGIVGEYKVTKHSSLVAQIGIPSQRTYSPKFNDSTTNFNVKTTSFLAGYRIYLSRKSLRGFYFQPYFKYVHFTGSGNGSSSLNGQDVNMEFGADYKGSGVGIQFGHQFMIAKRVVIDFYFIGPEINSSNVTFTATDATNTTPWNSTQSSDEQQNVSDFLNKIPVIGKKINLTVDDNNRTITANYKGLLPGFRIGLAIGIAL